MATPEVNLIGVLPQVPAVRKFSQQLRDFFVAEGIATEACFDLWIWQSTQRAIAHSPTRRKVIPFRKVHKRVRTQKGRAAR